MTRHTTAPSVTVELAQLRRALDRIFGENGILGRLEHWIEQDEPATDEDVRVLVRELISAMREFPAFPRRAVTTDEVLLSLVEAQRATIAECSSPKQAKAAHAATSRLCAYVMAALFQGQNPPQELTHPPAQA